MKTNDEKSFLDSVLYFLMPIFQAISKELKSRKKGLLNQNQETINISPASPLSMQEVEPYNPPNNFLPQFVNHNAMEVEESGNHKRKREESEESEKTSSRDTKRRKFE